MKKQAGGFTAMLQKMDDRQMAKFASKLPSWGSCRSLIIPSSLSLEQCSSEATARHKAEVIADAAGSRLAIADLTGGLGVDSWAFSRIFAKVLHNEKDTALSEAVKNNFAELGINNVSFCCEEVSPSSLAGGRIGTILEEFSPDVIFLDPARRSKSGGKVFLPEDCSPDITAILPNLLEFSPVVAVKLSPVMDISLLARRIAQISEIHVVGTSGECKELLCIIGRVNDDEYRVIAEELAEDGSVEGVCSLMEGRNTVRSSTSILATEVDFTTGSTLFVPSATALKTGCHAHLASEAGLRKLDGFTHIHIGSGRPESAFFKKYTVLEAHPFNKSSMKDIAARYPSSDVTARNIPLGSDQLREKIYGKAQPCGETRHHIFGVSTAACGRMLIVTKANG